MPAPKKTPRKLITDAALYVLKDDTKAFALIV